nr:unnamed protein product [Callosobruchus analis]
MKYMLLVLILTVCYLELCSAGSYCDGGVCILPKFKSTKRHTTEPPETEPTETEPPLTEEPTTEAETEFTFEPDETDPTEAEYDDTTSLFNALTYIDWSFLYEFNDVNEMCSAFYNKIYQLLDLYVPKFKHYKLNDVLRTEIDRIRITTYQLKNCVDDFLVGDLSDFDESNKNGKFEAIVHSHSHHLLGLCIN